MLFQMEHDPMIKTLLNVIILRKYDRASLRSDEQVHVWHFRHKIKWNITKNYPVNIK